MGAAVKMDLLLPRERRGRLWARGSLELAGASAPLPPSKTQTAEQRAPESACPGSDLLSAVRLRLVPQFPLVKCGINISLHCCKGPTFKPSAYSDLVSSRSSAKNCSLFLAKGGLTEHLASPPWPTRGGNLHGGTQQLGDRITPRPRLWEFSALTEVGVPLAVVACHVGAAATVPLADAALVQRVGGEEHPVTADGLQEGRWRGLLGGRRGCHRHGWTGGQSVQ